MITARAKSQAKKFAPLVILLSAMLALAACKLTTNGNSLTIPPAGNTEYLFATSNNQVLSFSVNITTGALGAPASVTGPALSQGIVANPAGTFLYVSDSSLDQVDAYSISSTGTLAQVGLPYGVGAQGGNQQTAAGLAMDPAGKFLYATDLGNNDMAGFTVNSTSGALTAISGSPFPAGLQPPNIVVDASGKFAYVADFGNVLGGVFGFTLNSAGGLTPVPGASPFDTGISSQSAGVATTGSFVYVTEQSSSVVVGLSIDSATGGLTTIPGSSLATGSQPAGVAVTPSGKYLYVANSGGTTISGYSVDSTTGVLTAIAGSPFAATVAPWYLAVDPSGSFLYATNPNSGDNTITGFTINSTTGALTQFTGAATAAGTHPVALTVVTVPSS
jgi:6-phosphogluconolactonase (cycloisomerase 2 family)